MLELLITLVLLNIEARVFAGYVLRVSILVSVHRSLSCTTSRNKIVSKKYHRNIASSILMNTMK